MRCENPYLSKLHQDWGLWTFSSKLAECACAPCTHGLYSLGVSHSCSHSTKYISWKSILGRKTSGTDYVHCAEVWNQIMAHIRRIVTRNRKRNSLFWSPCRNQNVSTAIWFNFTKRLCCEMYKNKHFDRENHVWVALSLYEHPRRPSTSETLTIFWP